MQLNHVFMYGLPLLQLLDLYTAKKFVVVRGSHKRYATEYKKNATWSIRSIN